MAGNLSLLALAFYLGTVTAVQFPRQVTSMFTNSSVATTTQAPTDPSASGAFCCQVYAPAAGLHWWYTNGSIEAVRETVVTEYLRYNNTIVPTATVTITDSSATDVIGQYNLGAGGDPRFPGIPATLNRPSLMGQQYDQTWVQTETVADLGYTTVASPTPFMAFDYIFVFSGTVDNAGTCMGLPPTTRTSTQSAPSASKGYNVYSEAMHWFGMAAEEPIGTVTNSDVQYTSFALSTPYISVVTTEAGEWYRPYKVTKLEDPFITWLAQEPQALSAVPDIRSCSAVSGAGAPNVHVQVSFLTTSSAKTSTTNGLYVNKATTTSAAPASQITAEAPVITTIPSDRPTTKVVETPSIKSSAQPEPSPSTATEKVSEGSVSPSQGQNDPPKSSEVSQDPPTQQATLASENSPQPSTRKDTAEPSTTSAPSSIDVTSNGGQSTTDVAQVTTPDSQASSLPQTTFVNSKDAPPDTSRGDNTQDSAIQATSASPAETSQIAPPVVIGVVTASPASSGGYVVGSQTLIPGSSAIEVSGTTYSLQVSGSAAVVNGQDVPVSTITTPAQPPAPIALGGTTGVPLTSDVYLVGDQTSSRGGSAIQISGTTYFLEPSGGNIVVNGEPTPVSAVEISSTQPAPFVVGGISVVRQSSDAYLVAGQTLNRGGSEIEVSGTTYSLEPSGDRIIVNGEPTPVSALQTARGSAVIIIGGVTALPQSSGVYVVADNTLSQGGSAVEISGTTYSLEASGNRLVVNGEPTAISVVRQPSAHPATVVIGDVTAAPQSSGAYYIVAGQTITPKGSAIEVSGVTYSLPKSGANIVINGATSYAAAASTPSPVVLGSLTAVPFLAGGYIVDSSQILSPGGSAVEVSGTTYSLPPSGNTVFVDGKSTTFNTATADAGLTIGSRTYTAIAASATPLVIASQTLVSGGAAATVSGTTYSLPSSGTSRIVVNGQTTTLGAAASGIAVFSVGSQELSFTQLNSGVVIASQTLYPGQTITVDGETLSLAASGGGIVIASGGTTTTDVLGGYIWQGIASVTSTDSSEASGSPTESASPTEVVSSTASATSKSTTISGSRSIATTSRPSVSSSPESSAVTTATGQAGHLEVSRWITVSMALALAVLLF